ncbi:hypothetical protein [Streptomyces sp. NPDC055210]
MSPLSNADTLPIVIILLAGLALGILGGCVLGVRRSIRERRTRR